MKKEEFNKYYRDIEPIVFDNKTLAEIKPLTKVKFDPHYKNNKIISKQEAIEDIRIFFRIIELCYCGYEYYRDRIDFSLLEQQIILSLSESDISAQNIGNVIYKVLSPYINDSHFSILADECLSLGKLYRAYFTGLVIGLINGNYVVTKGNKLVKKGYVFSFEQIKEYLFETLPDSKGNKRFLLGIYTSKLPKRIKIGGFELAVHPCKTDNIQQTEEAIRTEEMLGIPIVHNSSYSFETETPSFDDYFKLGKKYKDTKYLVWSILSNGGGNSNYPMNFIQGLNNHAVWNMDCAVINSPFISEGQKQEKSYSVFEGCVGIDESQYEGTLFVLQNKQVASSGESAIMYGRSVKKRIFVGSASMGCGQFGDVLTYKLPNSELFFAMGYKVFNMEGFEEGKGFFPDYWLDSNDPVKDVVEYIMQR